MLNLKIIIKSDINEMFLGLRVASIVKLIKDNEYRDPFLS